MHCWVYKMHLDPDQYQHPLEHHDTDAAHLLLVRQVLVVDSTRHRSRAVIVQVEVKLAIASAELQLFEEQRVVMQGESVENVEVGLKLN